MSVWGSLCRPSMRLVAALFCVSGFSLGRAEVVLQGSAAPLPGPDIIVEGDFGDTRGSNLFHSFRVFNILGGAPFNESVTFTSPSAGDAIQNVISRVTGGTSAITGARFSIIDGPLNSAIPGADFYFINPHGIIFGDNAALNVDGAFHASTADFVRLQDGGVFFADPATDSVLTAAPPSAFGFLGFGPAPITVGTSTFNILQAPAGQTLSLVGGDVNIGAPGAGVPGFLLAPEGRINLVSVASPGEAIFDDAGFYLEGFTRLGNVNVVAGNLGGTVIASAVDAKEIFIRGGRFVLEESVVSPGIFSVLGALVPSPDGGGVDIKVSGEVRISGTAPTIFEGTPPGVLTFAGSDTEITPPRDVPDIKIEGQSVLVTGSSIVQANRFGPGNPADVTITTQELNILDGASISANNFFEGPGGTLTVNAQHVKLSEDANPAFTGLAAEANFHPAYPALLDPAFPDPSLTRALTGADSGNITVNATGPSSLIVEGGAEITTDSFAFGRGGDIEINAGDIILDRRGAPTGAIASQSAFAGRAGDIMISSSGRVIIRNGFRVSAITGGTDDGGVVNVSAKGSIELSGTDAAIFSGTSSPSQELLDGFAGRFGVTFEFLRGLAGDILGIPEPDLFDVIALLDDVFRLVEIEDRTAGDGGRILITTPALALSDRARIDSSTTWDGNAGQIQGIVDSLNMANGAVIRSQSGLRLDNGQVLVGDGRAGTLNLAAEESISISGVNTNVSTTTLGDGDGGSISLTATNVDIRNGGSVTADSLGGSGLTGNIAIGAADTVRLIDGSVTTRATTSDGGDIKVTAPNVIRLEGSEISTSVESGEGRGGNINLDPEFITLNNSQIIANAFGGPGGNISLTATEGIIISDDSTVSASSALSTEGTIEFDSPDTDIAASIAVLPESFLDVSGALRSGCEAQRVAGGANSLEVAGRGSLPVHPDAYLPSFGIEGPAQETQTGLALGDGQISGGGAVISLAAIDCMM